MTMNRVRLGILWAMTCLAVLPAALCRGQELPSFDLTQADDRQGWIAAHHIASIAPSPDGLRISINGDDPYFHSPARDFPADQPLWLRMKFKSDQEGMLQVFYFRNNPVEEDSVRLPVRGGVWEDVLVPLPPLGRGYRVRIDPPGQGGEMILASLSYQKRNVLTEPAWLRPQTPIVTAASPTLRSGDLLLTHSETELGGYTLKVADQLVAIGFNRPMIGYVQGDQQRWLPIKAVAKVTWETNTLTATCTVPDGDGGTWTLQHRFSPGKMPGTLDVEVRASVDRERQVVFLPMFILVPGPNVFGESKTAALFPGLEYLDKDEPSSSEADITGPGSRRQVPDALKITMPLMTVLANDRYIGLIWEQDSRFAALFDSPDRLFESGGHVLGLLYPGSDGRNRVEGSLLPHWPEKLEANKPLVLRATLIGGKANSVIPAVQQYVALRGLPEIPEVKMDLAAYARLTAAGWMDSKLRDGNRYRHAWPGNFAPQPAADAAMFMQWSAARTNDAQLASRLTEAAAAALRDVPTAQYSFAAVSHVRYPVGALLYGHVAESAIRARHNGQALLSRFESDGAVLYKPGQTDYGRTHFAEDANGLTATVVWSLLESASVSGDAQLLAAGLRHLRALDKFANSAPRGAQTWECPLHTPDILASAYLVRSYVRGYELTGDEHFLEMARHWAWSGVPFVYLVNPANKPVGPYATIAVYGATNWVAPNWMGLPVQWCGLVYAEALYRLAPYDEKAPWRKLADGITASGIQQTVPLNGNSDRVGLLPDSFVLRAARRADPVINPGTVQANAVRLFKQPELYSFHAFRPAGLYVHAPGDLLDLRQSDNEVSFKITGCIKEQYWVLVSGCKQRPSVKINNADPPVGTVEYTVDSGVLVLRLQGDASVKLAK
jgi:hypothetical protein